jgi:hypothetical protein
MSTHRARFEADVDDDVHVFHDHVRSEAGIRRWRRLVSPAEWWRRRHWLVFAAAFLIPFGVLALGLVAASVMGDNSDTGQPTAAGVPATPSATVEGQWPQGVIFVVNTVPAMIRDNIAYPGDQRGYQFDGRTGDVWRIKVEPEDDFDPQIRLYEPGGSELAYNDDRAAGGLTAEMVVILPADGTYRLLVEAAAKNSYSTGTYLLSVFEE